MEGKAVFVKVDTNAMYELSSRYGVRSLPTFKFFLGGRKVYEFSGAGERDNYGNLHKLLLENRNLRMFSYPKRAWFNITL